MNRAAPRPLEIRARRAAHELYVRFADGSEFRLPFEYLRVFSPSAEVTGHGGPRLLLAGKEDVGIRAIEPVGQYAVRIIFDDGHDSGLYSWALLHELGTGYERNWKDYRERLTRAGIERREAPSDRGA